MRLMMALLGWVHEVSDLPMRASLPLAPDCTVPGSRCATRSALTSRANLLQVSEHRVAHERHHGHLLDVPDRDCRHELGDCQSVRRNSLAAFPPRIAARS